MRTLLLGLVALILNTAAVVAQSSYAIQRGDTLHVEVLEDANLNRDVLVLPDGSISFPLVGSLPAAGRSVDALRSALSAALASNFAAPPTVFVSVGQLAERRTSTRAASGPPVAAIFAMGEVAKPGKIDASPGVTLLQALAQAGGFTKFAATRRVELHRTDSQTGKEQIYLFDFRGRDGISGSTVLKQGDVIVVPERRLFE